jgi:NAD(P)-dependent dehydrogenase (short-subunit alcohol dehydrogenase family)
MAQTPSFSADQQKTIVITGATGGIGRANAVRFAEEGFNIILLGRSKEKLEFIYDEIEKSNPGRTLIHPFDFTTASADDYKILASAIDEQHPCLDGLIHNAGLLGTLAPIEHYSEESWENIMTVNLNAPFRLTKALLPSLSRSLDARIVFVSSSVGRAARAFWGAYGVSKFGLEGLMQTLAAELGKTTQIKVMSVNPGATRTEMRRDAYPGENPADVPTPESLMDTYLYLFGEKGRDLHGEAVNLREISVEK